MIMATRMCLRQTPASPAEGPTRRNPSLNWGRETKRLEFKGTEHEWLVKETGGSEHIRLKEDYTKAANSSAKGNSSGKMEAIALIPVRDPWS